jgi:TRAP-type C4-dicarboxylate transport system substrate-binding protein
MTTRVSPQEARSQAIAPPPPQSYSRVALLAKGRTVLRTLLLGLAVLAAANCPPVGAHVHAETVTLRFARAQPRSVDTAFAAALKRLSGGRVQIKTIAYNGAAADADQRIAADLAAGKLDVADVAAQAWESRGVSAFRVLQEPFLITSRALLDKVVADPQIAGPMLKALQPIGVTGLSVVPVGTRYLFAARTPLSTAAAFRKQRVRVNASAMTSGVLRNLGARPVTAIASGSAVQSALKSGTLDGIESDIATAVQDGTIRSARHVAVDVPLFVKVTTLAGNSAALRKLDDATARIVAEAARQATASTHGRETAAWKIACHEGLLPARTTPSELDAMRIPELPTYADIDSTLDVVLSQRIGMLATTVPRTDSWAGCGRGNAKSPTSLLDGRYAHMITDADAAANGDNPGQGNTGHYVLSIGNGRYALVQSTSGKDPVEIGSVTITGGIVVFRPDTGIASGSVPSTYRFEVFRDQLRFSADGTKPFDWLMTTKPWKPLR